jgi:hypothetical protein
MLESPHAIFIGFTPDLNYLAGIDGVLIFNSNYEEI